MYYLCGMKHVYPIDGVIQPYAWGGHHFLADLTHRPTPTQEPEAELWMGAHPKGPAQVHLPDGSSIPLDQLIEDRGIDILGPQVYKQFSGTWPFLLKVLDVQQMLSIQCHPNKQQAEAGFAREEKAGIPRGAPNRVFRDDNHKPELSVALSDFYLLHGFLPDEQIRERINQMPTWHPLLEQLAGGIRQLYAYLMRLPQAEVDELLQPLAQRLQASTPTDQEHPDFWARRALKQYTRPNGSIDRGIFSIYCMHIVHLQPGQAIYQEAGVLHAYLAGQVVEIMANSDNVMRGGLTVKHIDVDALLGHVVFEAAQPQIINGRHLTSSAKSFPAPVPDFLLKEINLNDMHPSYTRLGMAPSMFLVMEGEVSIVGSGLFFGSGQPFLLGAREDVELRVMGDACRLFEATLPIGEA